MHNERVRFKNNFKKRLLAATLLLIRSVGSLPKTTVRDIMEEPLVQSGTSGIAD